MFVDLKGRHVLVVGGGKIAARRVRTLLEFGCRITVVSPEICEELWEMLERNAGIVKDDGKSGSEKVKFSGMDEKNRIVWKKKKYESGELEMLLPDGMEANGAGDRKEYGFAFVLAAAVPGINAEVVRGCRKKRIPVNNASDRDQCDFYFPGIAKDGDTVVGITSGGGDHKMAARISGKIRELLTAMHRN